MDIGLYRRYLEDYVREAKENSDGSVRGIRNYLHEKQVKGFFVRHRLEKERALADARKAFDEHLHWPIEIVFSHLGLEL